MSDYNLFESVNRGVKRAGEALQDANSLFFESIFNSNLPPFVLKLNEAGIHAEQIYEEAMISMQHDDFEEAEHQFARNDYFCSLFPRLSLSRVEVASHEGMEALKRGANPNETYETVRLIHGRDREQKPFYF